MVRSTTYVALATLTLTLYLQHSLSYWVKFMWVPPYWKCVPHKVVGPTRVGVEKSVRVSVASTTTTTTYWLPNEQLKSCNKLNHLIKATNWWEMHLYSVKNLVVMSKNYHLWSILWSCNKWMEWKPFTKPR